MSVEFFVFIRTSRLTRDVIELSSLLQLIGAHERQKYSLFHYYYY
jgi:hypothetical protein